MIKFSLCFLCLIYLGIIIKRLLKLVKVATCLKTLADFLNSTTPTSYGLSNENSDYNDKLNKVLFIYPKISDFTDFYSPTLSYSHSDEKNYRNSVILYNELLMRRNFLIKEFKESFNPFVAIKATFSLPITLIQFLGIKPNIAFTNLINLIAWILAFVVNLYSQEIKTLITNFSKLL